MTLKSKALFKHPSSPLCLARMGALEIMMMLMMFMMMISTGSPGDDDGSDDKDEVR